MRIVDLSFLPLPVWSRGELVGFVSVLKFEVSLCYYGQERESECVCVVCSTCPREKFKELSFVLPCCNRNG